jgi:hypothetical protein
VPSLILRTYYASPAAPVGDFCTGSLLEKTSILRTYCAIPAAPVGDFCTESPAAPLGDFCTGSFGEDFDFANLLCYSGCTRRRLLCGVSHARVVSAAPRGDFGCNALNLGVEFFSSFLSPNSGVTLFSLPDSLFLPNFKPV